MNRNFVDWKCIKRLKAEVGRGGGAGPAAVLSAAYIICLCFNSGQIAFGWCWTWNNVTKCKMATKVCSAGHARICFTEHLILLGPPQKNRQIYDKDTLKALNWNCGAWQLSQQTYSWSGSISFCCYQGNFELYYFLCIFSADSLWLTPWLLENPREQEEKRPVLLDFTPGSRKGGT